MSLTYLGLTQAIAFLRPASLKKQKSGRSSHLAIPRAGRVRAPGTHPTSGSRMDEFQRLSGRVEQVGILQSQPNRNHVSSAGQYLGSVLAVACQPARSSVIRLAYPSARPARLASSIGKEPCGSRIKVFRADSQSQIRLTGLQILPVRSAGNEPSADSQVIIPESLPKWPSTKCIVGANECATKRLCGVHRSRPVRRPVAKP